eukprot:4680145-Alexandrium_andersonii.AAC.1
MPTTLASRHSAGNWPSCIHFVKRLAKAARATPPHQSKYSGLMPSGPPCLLFLTLSKSPVISASVTGA